MNPILTGAIVAVALIAAFVAGAFIEFDDGSVALNVEVGEQGPLEQVGEAIDEAASADN